MSEKLVKNTLVSEPQILTLSPFFTIFNEKNVILLHPLKIGSSDITIFSEKEYYNFKVQVKPKGSGISSQIIKNKDFEVVPLDSLPLNDKFDIDTPPEVKK